MQKNRQRDVMEREGGICFKQNWFVPHLHFIIFIPTLTTLMLLRRGLRDVYPKKWSCQDQFCPWRTPTKFSPCCLTCTSVMPCFLCRPVLWQSNTLIWSILSLLILAYLTLGESQLAGCFLGLPGVSVFLAIVVFPFGWTGKEGAHRTCCNVTAILLLSGHRSSANPCCGLPRAQLFLVVQTPRSSVLLCLIAVSVSMVLKLSWGFFLDFALLPFLLLLLTDCFSSDQY